MTIQGDLRVRQRAWSVAGRVAAKLGLIDRSAAETLADAYRVIRSYQAPFMVKIAGDMLTNLRAEYADHRGRHIAFLGRDGHSLAIATAELDPHFYRRHCANLVISRAPVEGALQDLERNLGRSFPEVEPVRTPGRVTPADTVGGFHALTDYLHSHRLPVGVPDSRLTLIDTGYKGTVQELLSATYPGTAFDGRYAFHGETPYDPHPGTKKGYEVHVPPQLSRDGTPLDTLPADEALTFAHQVALGSIEETLNGPMSSPTRIRDGRPDQTGVQSPALSGLNPVRVSPRFADPTIREGVKVVSLIAVRDCARASATDGDGDRQLVAGAHRYRRQIRGWIAADRVDPALGELLDSFVRRTDKRHAAALAQLLRRGKISAADSVAVWTSYDNCRTDDDKRVFVESMGNSMRADGRHDGRDGQAGRRFGGGLARAGRAGREPR